MKSLLSSISESIQPFKDFQNISPGKANMYKSYMLEIPTPIILDKLGEEYEDVSDKFNFKPFNTHSHNTPDILIHNKKITIELKNWNNTYTIGFITARTEIVSRFEGYPGYRKVLINSNIRWKKGVKEYLQSCGVEIHELGEFLDGNNLTIYNKLKQILVDILGGYRRITRSLWGFLFKLSIFLLPRYLRGLDLTLSRLILKVRRIKSSFIFN